MRKIFCTALLFVFALFFCTSCSLLESAAPKQKVASMHGAIVPSLTTPTPEPTEEPEESQDLQYGSTDPTVRRLQERLIELGYMNRNEATDFFDLETEASLKIFQKQIGIDATGIATIATLTRIFAQDAPAKATPEPGIDDVPVPSDSNRPTSRTYAASTELAPLLSSAPESSEPQRTGPLSGKKIGIDPGHQEKGNSSQEPIAPGAAQTKAKVSSGTQGTATGVPEYIINLAVGLKLRDLLLDQGAEVVMTRSTNDVDISNSERARMLNDAQVDLAIRLHCDGENDESRNGAFVLIPSGQYTTDIQEASKKAAQDILSGFVATTGARNLGLSKRSDQTGFNWSTVPVVNIEMGHLSNSEEDQKLTSESYQDLCALGIQQGILEYFS